MCGATDRIDRYGNPCVDVSHIRTIGSGRGDTIINVETGEVEGNIASQCHRCHMEMHNIGVHSYNKKYKVDMYEIARYQYNEYLKREETV